MHPAPGRGLAIYPGSFDPVTNGHLDVVERALGIFDHILFAIAPNEGKHPLFTAAERLGLASEAIRKYGDRVTVEIFDGLLVHYARDRGAGAIIRGLRAVADFEFEFQLALMNRKLAPSIETIFLMPTEHLIYTSSSLIKEIARLGGEVSCLVPANVLDALQRKFHTSAPPPGPAPRP